MSIPMAFAWMPSDNNAGTVVYSAESEPPAQLNSSASGGKGVCKEQRRGWAEKLSQSEAVQVLHVIFIPDRAAPRQAPLLLRRR